MRTPREKMNDSLILSLGSWSKLLLMYALIAREPQDKVRILILGPESLRGVIGTIV